MEKRSKLKKIKEVYCLFKSCLLGRAKDKWAKVLDKAEAIDLIWNYDANNIFGVEAFYDYQKKLVSKLSKQKKIG